jgi:multiple sugar transport system substrate-binding protein
MGQEPKKVDRRNFIYAGLGAVALIAMGAAAYVAMNPPVVTETVTTATTATTTVPTTSVITTTTATTLPTTSVVTTTKTTTAVVRPVTVLTQSSVTNPMNAASAMFTEETGIPVELINVPYADLQSKGMVELSIGNPAVDVLSTEIAYILDWHKYLEDLYPYIERDKYDLSGFSPTFLGYYSPPFYGVYEKGKPLYSIPYTMGMRVLGYRIDLYEKEGIKSYPKTIPELLDVAIKLNKEGISGYGMVAGTNLYCVTEWLHFLWAFGGQLLEWDGEKFKISFNDERGIAALQFWSDLRNKYKVVQASATEDGLSEIISLGQQGVIAMGTFYTSWVIQMNDPSKSKVPGKWWCGVVPYHPDYAKPDTLRTALSGWGASINKASKNKEAAWEFVKFIARPDVQLKLSLQAQTAPAQISVLDHPDYIKAFPGQEGVKLSFPISRNYTDPPYAKYNSLREILMVELNNAVRQKKTPKEALDDAAKLAKEKLGLS